MRANLKNVDCIVEIHDARISFVLICCWCEILYALILFVIFYYLNRNHQALSESVYP